MAKKSDNYGIKLAKLEKIVEDLESENLELDKMISCVEEGLELADGLKKELDEAENKIVKLKQKYHLDNNAD